MLGVFERLGLVLMLKILIIAVVLLALTPLVMGQDDFDPENDAFRDRGPMPLPKLEIKRIRVIINPVFDRTDIIRIKEDPWQYKTGFIHYDVFQTDSAIYYTMTPRLTPSPPPKSPSVVFSGESGNILLHFVCRDLNDTSTIRIQYDIDSANTVRFQPSMIKGWRQIEMVIAHELPEGALWIQLSNNSKLYRKLRGKVKDLSDALIIKKGFYQEIPLEVYRKDGGNYTDLGWLLVLKPKNAAARKSILSLREKYDVLRQTNRR